MRKALRIAGLLVAAVLVLILGGLLYLGLAYPRKRPPSDLRVETSPELLARGEYLFDHVTGCVVCHSPGRVDLVGTPVAEDQIGAGGEPFPLGPAGTLYSRNITPAALGEWTDGEIIRALREGVSRDGTPLFPLMPYYNYRMLSERDVHALVAYVRTLKPRVSDVPQRELHFPMTLLIRLMPSPAGPYPQAPLRSDTVAYGHYLVTAASCGDCHSPMDDRGRPVPGRELSGGNSFPTGEGWLARSANITPDSASGIGAWSRDRFVSAFKSWEPRAAHPRRLEPGERRSPMPWLAYSGMSEEDLAAIYAYLRTVAPVRHEVVRFEREREPAAK